MTPNVALEMVSPTGSQGNIGEVLIVAILNPSLDHFLEEPDQVTVTLRIHVRSQVTECITMIQNMIL